MKRIASMLIIMVFLFCGCAKKTSSLSFIAMDTYMTLSAECDEETLEKVQNEIIRLEDVFSHNENSELNTLNCNNGGVMNEDMELLLKKSLEYALLTEGAFNPAMYDIISLWDILNMTQVPSDDEISAALKSCDYTKITVENSNAALNGAKLDFGGIAKGYASDKAVELLKSEGVTQAVLSLGGNIAVIGNKNGSGYNVGIVSPVDNGNAATLKVSDCFVVTSGSYQRYVDIDGVRYHHIFGKDGYPADNELVSVTVVGSNGTYCDAISTALFVMGLDNAIEFVNSDESIDAVFITKDNRILVSDGLVSKFTLASEDFTYEKI